ncbi:cystinosin-like protein ERS1 [Sporobolomyces salmoneus]|uniref:cystinosin-like protein ERS1 n=1 Tax=Sporobolomyces salmoneus TaxID=183962 RepID=UPI00317D5A65
MGVATWISSLLGWTYTIAWSLSFYPQFILNYRRKSSTGLSLDFCAINPAGHASLLIVNSALYASSIVRRQYQARHDGHLPQARLNDVWFSAHATLLATLTLGQSFFYRRDPAQKISSFNRYFLLFVFASTIILAFLAATPSVHRIEYLDVIQYLSYIKLYISFSKYVPQVKLNYQRKSTVGWSIENILLDLTGGTLSLAQLVLDSWIADDWKGITGNPAKLGLSLLTLGFDAIFIIQHYVLYRHSTTTLLDPASPPHSSSVTAIEEDDDASDDGRPDQRNGLGGGEGRRKKTRRNDDGERRPLLDTIP